MSEKAKRWWKAAGIRAVKTMAQSAGATLVTAVTIWEVDWKAVLGISLLAGIASLTTSLKGLPELEEMKEDKESEEK